MFAARPQGAEAVLRLDSQFQGLTELAEAWNLVMVVSQPASILSRESDLAGIPELSTSCAGVRDACCS